MASAQRAAGLNELLRSAGLAALDPPLLDRFEAYLALILRWNDRINLTAIRDEEGILRRHFVESIFCARALPVGIRSLLDFGSGAGLPGIPIALCRPEIAVTLAESSGKKASFLNEAVRVLGVSSTVYAGRAENLAVTFDCVILRAVDRMKEATRAGAKRVAPGGSLALMTTSGDLERLREAVGGTFSWIEPSRLPGGEGRVLALGQRVSTQS
ncbi:MAG TPA: 16S rRNA (guanine(527)-N(7))-methyltransferase RsmG [Terracidiphilus sp.]|nr:16S rRNA (guanine(527)-N(7))-methyltransferase RsmG [Terracidiphilus sp.]